MTPALQVTTLDVLFLSENIVEYIALNECKIERRGSLVVKALRYKPAGSGFDSRWCHCNFSVT